MGTHRSLEAKASGLPSVDGCGTCIVETAEISIDLNPTLSFIGDLYIIRPLCCRNSGDTLIYSGEASFE